MGVEQLYIMHYALFREAHDESSAMRLYGLPGDGGVVFFNNFFDDGETEACAAFFAAGDEGVEEGFGDGGRDAGAVVFDGECDAVAGVFGAYAYGAVSVDGFHGIFAEVYDDAQELDFVARDVVEIIFFADEVNVSLFGLAAEQFERMHDERVHGCFS